MQDADVLDVGALSACVSEGVVRPPERQRREKLLTVAVASEGAGLAHEYGASAGGNPFASTELTRELRRVLRPGGAVAWNVIGSLGGNGAVQELCAAARGVFETVRIVPVVDLDERYEAEALRNVVVVAVA